MSDESAVPLFEQRVAHHMQSVDAPVANRRFFAKALPEPDLK
jgi:hypothetical protein